jgi:hypothetical protein
MHFDKYQSFCDQQMHNLVSLTPHSTGYTHSPNHDAENLLMLYFNGKNLKKSNFSKDQRELPEDGPYGLKHVGASIQMF